MPTLRHIVEQLKKQETHLAKQLTSIRNAISLLEFGGWAPPIPYKVGRPATTRKRRKFSAATIAKMRAAQKARWAKAKAAK
jgi:hypothetical protein